MFDAKNSAQIDAIAKVRPWCLEHYNDGGDVIFETFDDEELVGLAPADFDWLATDATEKFLAICQDWTRRHQAYRKEVYNTAF